MASSALSQDQLSRILGYVIQKGFFNTTTNNLPQRILMFAEANDANQSALDVTENQITSAKQAGDLYGYGSPMHIAARILFPISGDILQGIYVGAIAQPKASGAVAKSFQIAPAGVALRNGTHYLVIGGREGLDGVSYAINIVAGDVVHTICDKIVAAVTAVLGCPMLATDNAYNATLTAKWSGLTSNGLTLSIDTGDDTLGLTYAITSPSAGSGTPSIAAALALIGNNWVTTILNSYGTEATTMAALEAFNGKPDPTSPTGRFAGIIFKPLIAVTGSVADDPSSITDTRLNDVTIAIAPAPNSAGLAMEAAANMIALFAPISNNTPNLDVAGKSYPDMPTPVSIGSMADYNNRNNILKKGCSTVDLVAEAYQVQDFVVTYHPVGETPPQYRYCRSLVIDDNYRFTYYLEELINVLDHSIANDNDVVSAPNVVKPKQWKQIVGRIADDMVNRGMTVDSAFTKAGIVVNISATNPDRFETFFPYKRSGFARQTSTVAQAGFNFGTLN